MNETIQHLTPTSHPDLFVGKDGRLVHRYVGRLGRKASRLLRLVDGSTLKVYEGAPQVSLKVPRRHFPPREPVVASPTKGLAIADITKFMSDASGYIQVAETAVALFAMLEGLGDETTKQLNKISQELEDLMRGVGAADYLNLIRAMDQMRANATALTQMLANEEIREQIMRPGTIERIEFAQGDFNLHTAIIALLDPDEGFFRRAYFESLIHGDGNWESVIPDRPVDDNGTTFDHRLAMPTVMYMISVRLGTMKFMTPDFVSRGTFSVEMDLWWRRIQQLSDQMANFVRPTPVMPIAQQCSRRLSAGQTLGNYQDWETHCAVAPPDSISPIGAIDITTGDGSINWDYTQFDEWYLRQGDLHGRNAGYWPPSIGPAWYQPPANATGLPPMDDATIQAYNLAAGQDATLTARAVQDQIGVGAASTFAWMMFDFAYPGAGTP